MSISKKKFSKKSRYSVKPLVIRYVVKARVISGVPENSTSLVGNDRIGNFGVGE
jgi:hypothetical protein